MKILSKCLNLNNEKHTKFEKGNNERKSIRLYFIIFIFLYSFFALDRIKKTMSFTIEGVRVTNQIWIIVLAFGFLAIISNGKKVYQNKYNQYIYICTYIYILIMIIGGFNTKSILQYGFAILYFVVPMLLYFITSKLTIREVKILLKVIIVTSLFYALFSIILTKNYAFFISLVGNPADKSIYHSQYRPNTMFGSSISVSYYFNLILPILFYLYYRSENKRWKNILTLTIISNIAAVFVLLSRTSVICTILIIVGVYLFIRNKSYSKKTNIVLIILLIVTGIYVLENYDLRRLASGFDNDSISERITVASLGMHIFSKKPIFGSGMGRYFNRIFMYEDKFILVDGIIGLIDPHNMYILVLSETGIIGLILLVSIFILLIRNFSNIKEKELRWAAYISIFAFLFDAMGGSHLFNEISFASVFWIYMGIFNVFVPKKDGIIDYCI